MKSLLFRATAPAVTLASCLAMFGSVASAQSMPSFDGSHNRLNISHKTICIIHNTNDIDISNRTSQSASSGNVNVTGNDDVGNLSSGSASNSNESTFNVNASNTTAACGGQLQQQPGQGGEVTPPVTEVNAPAQMVSTPSAASTAPVGGMGGGEANLPVAQQVAVVPTGGVGAGEGTPAYLAGLTAVTLASGALAFRRVSKAYQRQF